MVFWGKKGPFDVQNGRTCNTHCSSLYEILGKTAIINVKTHRSGQALLFTKIPSVAIISFLDNDVRIFSCPEIEIWFPACHPCLVYLYVGLQQDLQWKFHHLPYVVNNEKCAFLYVGCFTFVKKFNSHYIYIYICSKSKIAACYYNHHIYIYIYIYIYANLFSSLFYFLWWWGRKIRRSLIFRDVYVSFIYIYIMPSLWLKESSSLHILLEICYMFSNVFRS
jgi:hypothetical protein